MFLSVREKGFSDLHGKSQGSDERERGERGREERRERETTIISLVHKSDTLPNLSRDTTCTQAGEYTTWKSSPTKLVTAQQTKISLRASNHQYTKDRYLHQAQHASMSPPPPLFNASRACAKG